MIFGMLILKNVNEILEKRGLTPKGALHKKLDEEVELRCRPYVTRKHGFLEKSGKASTPSVGFVTWSRPYAKYQYYGYKMIGKKSKVLTSIPLKSHSGGLRGSQWLNRMKIDWMDSISQTLTKLAGGKAK